MTGRYGFAWCLIAVFDSLLACLFVSAAVADVGAVRRPEADATVTDLMINRVVSFLDGGMAVTQVGAALSLIVGTYVVRHWQRAVLWGLLIRTGFIFTELTLPSEGGVGGFLLIIAFGFTALLTALALWSVVHLNRASAGQEKVGGL